MKIRWGRRSLVSGAVALAVAAAAGLTATGWAPLGASVSSAAAPAPSASVPPEPLAAATLATPAVTEASVPSTPEVTESAAVPAARLKPGEKPPQFVVVSFDGGGGLDSWQYWRDLSRRADADLTFFRRSRHECGWHVGY